MVLAVGANVSMASRLAYTSFFASDAETGARVFAPGQGSISVSTDGGATYETIVELQFHSGGVAFARTGVLNHYPDDALVDLEVVLERTRDGRCVAPLLESATLAEFKDSLQRGWYGWTYRQVEVGFVPDIVETAIAAGDFTTLVAALQLTGLDMALSAPGPFTVFAPTDAAFAALPPGVLDSLLADPGALADVLLYHVAEGALDSTAVAGSDTIMTLLGKDVAVTVSTGVVKINDAVVQVVDVEACNGIIHVIDAVLVPPTLPNIVEIAVADGRFTTLVTALQLTGLDVTLQEPGPFTVFAPTDDAFAALPPGVLDALIADPGALANVLLYHVVAGRLKAEDVVLEDALETVLGEDVQVRVVGGEVFVNDSKVIITDIMAENGVIHVIDAVLIPPDPKPDIVDTAVDAGIFTTLVTALELTGLDDVLRGDGPFTVFAPTDDAFAALPDGLLDKLIAHPDLLTAVLLYHVVDDELDSMEVGSRRWIRTVGGGYVLVWKYDGNLFINRSKVIVADVEASNGVIHVVDEVLVPRWVKRLLRHRGSH